MPYEHGPVLEAIEQELRAHIIQQLTDRAPFTVVMVKRVRRDKPLPEDPFISGLRFLFDGLLGPAPTETVYEDVEAEPLDAVLVETPDQLIFRTDRKWIWDGDGVFAHFIVRDRHGDTVLKGGALSGTPIEGSDIDPQITISIPRRRP